MNIKTAGQLAGVAAIIAGLLFSVIQFIHPANELASLTTNQWQLAHTLNFLFPFFGLLGITGIYLKQAKQAGYLGLVGYVALFGAFSLMMCFAFYEAYIAPVLVDEAPQYVLSALSILDGEKGPAYIGPLYQLNGALYLLGGLIFGISTLRAGLFPKWAGGLVVVGVLVTLSAAVLPMMARPSAIIFSLGVASLGYLLAAGRYRAVSD